MRMTNYLITFCMSNVSGRCLMRVGYIIAFVWSFYRRVFALLIILAVQMTPLKV